MSAVVLDRLTRRYGARRGVESVSLSVPEGCLFGFLGPNGAGKTTTIRAMLGLLRPTEGRASIFGRDCWRDAARVKADVGYLPGDFRMYPWMTGKSAVRVWSGVRRMDLRKPAADLSDALGLDLSRRVREMSRGTKQKLGLVLALAHSPRLAILDEPTTALDPLVQDALLRWLRALAAKGHTVFFSSHMLREVEQLCDRVAIVRAGRLVVEESLQELRRTTGRRVTIQWVPGETAPARPPESILSGIIESPGRWEAMSFGPVGALLHWLAAQRVEDVTIDEPDLESVFRAKYNGAEESPASAPPRAGAAS